jgi:hypothetical protein
MDIGFGQVKVCLKKGQAEIQTPCFPRIFADAKANNWGLNTHRIYEKEMVYEVYGNYKIIKIRPSLGGKIRLTIYQI